MRASVLLAELVDVAICHPDEAIVLFLEDFCFNSNSENNGTQGWSNEKKMQEYDKLYEESGLKNHMFKLASPKSMPMLEELRNGRNIIVFNDIKETLKYAEQR